MVSKGLKVKPHTIMSSDFRLYIYTILCTYVRYTALALLNSQDFKLLVEVSFTKRVLFEGCMHCIIIQPSIFV